MKYVVILVLVGSLVFLHKEASICHYTFCITSTQIILNCNYSENGSICVIC